jgi:exosortase
MNGRIIALTQKVRPEILIISLVLLGIYLPVFTELVSDWEKDPNYSHGFLVPLVSLFLLWKKRKELSQIQTKVSPLGLGIITGGLFLLLVGTAGAEYFTVRLSFVLLLFGLVWYFGGARMAKTSSVPIWYLVLAIPVPYVIYFAVAFPLQIWATKITAVLLHLLGMPSLRQGNVIHLPGYSLEVVEACSGLRSLVSLLALSGVYAHLTQKTTLKKLILFLSAVPIALVANIFRISMTALGAYLISPKMAEDFLHELSGLVVFIVSFICLFIFGEILKRIGTKKPALT